MDVLLPPSNLDSKGLTDGIWGESTRDRDQPCLIVFLVNVGTKLCLPLYELNVTTVAQVQEKLEHLRVCYPGSSIQLLDSDGAPLDPTTSWSKVDVTDSMSATLQITDLVEFIKRKAEAIAFVQEQGIPGLISCVFRSIPAGLKPSIVVQVDSLDHVDEAQKRLPEICKGFPVKVIKHQIQKIVLI